MADKSMGLLTPLDIYDTLYGLAAGEGREDVLFGTCVQLSREAFCRSVLRDVDQFPLLWFEIPLSGNPRFDLHVAYSDRVLKKGVQFVQGAGAGYDELFAWYGHNEQDIVGLALGYDVSQGSIEKPAIHVKVNGYPFTNAGGFFKHAGRPDAEELYLRFANSLPKGWTIWYAGLHPGRPGTPLRVDCYVEDELRKAYVDEPNLLEQQLEAIGFVGGGECVREISQLIMRTSQSLELQFDVMADGSLGPTIGLSAVIPIMTARKARLLFADGGSAAALLQELQSRGIADARWKEIPGAITTKLISFNNGMLVLIDIPTFTKVRIRDGKVLDAKVYMQAGARFLS